MGAECYNEKRFILFHDAKLVLFPIISANLVGKFWLLYLCNIKTTKNHQKKQ